jgi:hypothetical protein
MNGVTNESNVSLSKIQLEFLVTVAHNNEIGHIVIKNHCVNWPNFVVIYDRHGCFWASFDYINNELR